MMDAVQSAYRRRSGVKFWNMHYFKVCLRIGQVHDTFLPANSNVLSSYLLGRMLLAQLERSSNGFIVENSAAMGGCSWAFAGRCRGVARVGTIGQGNGARCVES
jgi:hypothetical protein